MVSAKRLRSRHLIMPFVALPSEEIPHGSKYRLALCVSPPPCLGHLFWIPPYPHLSCAGCQQQLGRQPCQDGGTSLLLSQDGHHTWRQIVLWMLRHILLLSASLSHSALYTLASFLLVCSGAPGFFPYQAKAIILQLPTIAGHAWHVRIMLA